MKMKMTAQQIESMKDTTSARSGIRECLNGEVFGCGARNGRSAATVILLGCLLVAFNAPVVASTTQTAISVGDTYVRSGSPDVVPFGSIQCGYNSSATIRTRRGLVRFNTALPGGNVVNGAGSASLVMGCYNRQVGTTTASIGLGKPNYADLWTETTATWNLNSALSGAFAYQNVVDYGNYTWTWNGYNNIPGIQKGIVVWNNTSEGDQDYAKSFNDRENTGSGYSYPTLTITYNYTAPSGEPNVIRTWGYLGHFVDASDHQTRIYRNYINSTYSLVPVDEHQVAPNLANGSTGPALGSGYSGPFYWKKGVSTADIVNLLSAQFYNAAAKDNGATYCVTYIYYNAPTKTDVYLGAGSDDCSKVWLNGNYVGYWDSPMGRGTQVDQDWYGPMTLNNGWNRLVMKVENGGGGYGVYARFADSTGAYVGNCTYFNYDANAPSDPAVSVSGVTSGVWQNSVSSPTFTWTSGADPEPSRTTDEGKSGVRGQKYYFGTSSTGAFTTFKEGTSGLSYAPGAQADGTYYFRVGTVDYALNDSSVATFEFKYDATAPNAITAFGSSNPGSSDTDWYNYSGNLVWTWTAATDALSGLDGYAIAQDQSATTQPGATMTHQETTTSYTLSGPQVTGEYYLHVRSKDIAGNWLAAASTAHRRIRIDRTAPTASLTIGTVTTDSIAVTGAGTDAHSGLNAATAYNYSRTGASASGATGASYTWTGLTANTEYTGLYVTVSDQAVATPNTAASSPQSKWTLPLAPAAGSATPDNASPCTNTVVTWTAAGFGPGYVAYYRYVFDKNASYSFTDTELQWSGGTIQTIPDSEGTWYLHLKAYNGANEGNGTYDYALPAHTIPAVPADGAPTSTATTSVTWSWSDVTGESGYRVKDTDGNNLSGDLAADTTQWTESSGISANTQYTRKIYSYNDCGESAGSTGQSRYSLQIAPAAPSFGAVTVDSIVLNTVNPVNLTAGSSGVYFDSATAGGDGGIDEWVQGTTDTATGLSPNTQYTFQVNARNGDSVETGYSATASKYTLIQTPSGVSFGAITADSIEVMPVGTLDNLTAGSSGVKVSNTTAGTDSGWMQNTTGYTSSGLTPNTPYTFVARARNGEGVETGDCVPVVLWTLGAPPTAGSVTPDSANPCANSPVTWTAAGFGSGSVEYYRYVFDQNASYVFTDTEPQWSGGTIQTTPDSEGAWYLHVKGYNGANVGNGTFDYAVTARPAAAISAITGNNAVAIGQAGETYLVTLTSGSSYAWTVPSGAVITAGETGPDNNQITVTFGSASGDVTVTETTAESCVGAPVTLAVGVGPNHAPVAPPAKSLSTPMNTPVTVYLVKLLAGATDADGDPLSISAAGPNSVQGGTVVVQGTTLIYTPATGYTGADSFTYTISDGQGGTAIGTVNVTVLPPAGGLSPNLVFWPAYADGKFSVTFAGIPGYTYTVEYATQLPPTSGWQKLENYTAGANGLFEVTDIQISPSPARYYRTVYPAY